MYLAGMAQARAEEERIAALVAGRRQREATLVADFSSDEVYDLMDEESLAMGQTLRESRRRVKSLCEGRKLADSTELLTKDLVRELQSFLTRYWPLCGKFCRGTSAILAFPQYLRSYTD